MRFRFKKTDPEYQQGSGVEKKENRGKRGLQKQDRGENTDAGQEQGSDAKQEPDLESAVRAMAEIATESWRYERAVEKALQRMDVMDAERFSRQYQYFASKVNRALGTVHLSVPDMTGLSYSTGLPVQVMNLEEFGEEEQLIVTQTIEPVIMYNGHVIKSGIVMVDRVPQQADL